MLSRRAGLSAIAGLSCVSRHAVFCSRMLSGMGRNVQFYCERFGTSSYDAVTVVRKGRFWLMKR